MKPVQIFIKNKQVSICYLRKRTGFILNFTKITLLILLYIFLCVFLINKAIATVELIKEDKNLQGDTKSSSILTNPLDHSSYSGIEVHHSLPNISAMVTFENSKLDNLGHIGSSSIEIKEHFFIPLKEGNSEITASKFFDKSIIHSSRNSSQVVNNISGSEVGNLENISGFRAKLTVNDLANVLNLNNFSREASVRPFDVRIAVVDIEAIFEHSIAIKDIRHKINKISNKIQKEMSERELELKKFEEEIIKQRGIISESEFNDKLVEFHRRVSSTQKLLQKRKISLDKAHTEAISAVHKNSLEIITMLAKNYGFNMVIPTTQVVYAKNDLDITMKVISELNKKLTHIEIKYDDSD